MSRTILLEKHALKFLEKLDKDTACRIIDKLEKLEAELIQDTGWGLPDFVYN